ncbi:P-loop NTPase fold protein, partial [Pluralibacter gergoviae]|uniref:P-loop NTPase fold protein n=1 Tax=Pluralibacter gergoviae TaxID=61647 RepID=UPI0006C30A3F
MFFSGANDKFENGFSQDSDIFKRKPLFDLIINFVNNSPESGLVLALDDRWGNGKTSFLKMMTSEIKNDAECNINVIYYDAFENDYHTDPFISLTSEIYQNLNEQKSKFAKIQTSLIETGKKVGASFIKGGVNYAINAATGGILNGSAIESAKDTISKAINDPIEKYIEDKIKSGEKEKTDINNFKKVLKSIYETYNTKTLFIIDEL